MAEPYRLSPHERGPGFIQYDGPFGPLLIQRTNEGAVPNREGFLVTGQHVERAVLSWNNLPDQAKHGFSVYMQAIRGVTITIDGVTVRARIPIKTMKQWRREVRIERSGENRILRLRRFRNYSLETASGTRLIYVPRFKWRGKVHPEADVIDVVVLILLDISGIAGEIRPTYF